jgi:DNA-binding transcriptional ArsR family regulator
VNRLRIVQRLAHGEASVAELTDHVGLSQPLVSWHIGKLRLAGVVATTRIGRETVCRLRAEAFAEFARRERAVLGLAYSQALQDDTAEPTVGLQREPKAAVS